MKVLRGRHFYYLIPLLLVCLFCVQTTAIDMFAAASNSRTILWGKKPSKLRFLCHHWHLLLLLPGKLRTFRLYLSSVAKHQLFEEVWILTKSDQIGNEFDWSSLRVCGDWECVEISAQSVLRWGLCVPQRANMRPHYPRGPGRPQGGFVFGFSVVVLVCLISWMRWSMCGGNSWDFNLVLVGIFGIFAPSG